jgi:hypothetical protein
MPSDIPTKEELLALAQIADAPCVSIYMPTHPVGPEIRQDPIRLRNLLKKAAEELRRAGASDGGAALLAPAQALPEDEAFWQHGARGLALFMARETFARFRLPFAPEEEVIVAPRFNLRPVLPLLTGDGAFYLLAIAQGGLRLLRGSRYGLEELETGALPRDLREALREDVPERGHETQVRPPPRRGANADIFHGESVADLDHKNRILRFFREVDRALQKMLPDLRTPLVLAGVEYLLPIYREASTHPQLLSEGVTGNPEGLTLDELHAPAWKIVEPVYAAAEGNARSRFEEAAGQQAKGVAPLRAVDTIREVVPAASDGRIESLFVATDAHCWGRYDPATHSVETREAPLAGDEDLFDHAAIGTLANGGTVYAVPPERIPGGRQVAAILRY